MSEKEEFYELQFVSIDPSEPGEFFMATAALRICLTCGTTIAGMGGPGQSICKRCGDVILSGRAIGCIKWSEP